TIGNAAHSSQPSQPRLTHRSHPKRCSLIKAAHGAIGRAVRWHCKTGDRYRFRKNLYLSPVSVRLSRARLLVHPRPARTRARGHGCTTAFDEASPLRIIKEVPAAVFIAGTYASASGPRRGDTTTL